MWRELVLQNAPTAIFAPGANAIHIAQAEQLLQVALPTDLRALFIESDGIVGEYGPHYIWSLDMLIHQNLAMRQDTQYQENYMPFEHLLFFADAGVDGIRFAFPIRQQHIPSPSPIYRWEPIEDNRIWAASSLAEYLTRWLDGTLTI